MGGLGSIGRSIGKRIGGSVGRSIGGIIDMGDPRNAADVIRNPNSRNIQNLLDPAGVVPRDWWKKKKKKKPSEDPRLTSLRKELTSEAKSYKKNLGQTRGDMYQGLLNEYNDARDEGTKLIREGTSRRGLLYSGIRAGKESELQSGLESQLNEGKYNINRETSELLKKKQRAAQMVGLDSMSALQSSLENYYNLQMQNQLARRQAFGQLASGLGYAAGAYYGSQPGGMSGGAGQSGSSDGRGIMFQRADGSTF